MIENERNTAPENGTDKPFVNRLILWAVCAAAATGECFILLPLMGVQFMKTPYAVVELLMLFYSLYFLFWAPRRLPAYYDENKISIYYHKGVKMSMPGVYFNNRNWPHIVAWTRKTILATLVGYPVVFLLMFKLIPGFEPVGALIIMFVFAFGFIISIYIAAKRYE